MPTSFLFNPLWIPCDSLACFERGKTLRQLVTNVLVIEHYFSRLFDEHVDFVCVGIFDLDWQTAAGCDCLPLLWS